MEKFNQIDKIIEIYSKGGNIIQYLKSIDNNEKNSIEDILISYDFQSGSYIKNFSKKKEFKNNYCNAIAKRIEDLGNFESLIEVGVGEATTLALLLKNLSKLPPIVSGFDISWSRLKFARDFLNEIDFKFVNLFSANLFQIPLQDNSYDIVFTSHAIEPNGGREEEALKELYRIAKKYIVLLEPAYEFASDCAKERMKKHGYITSLFSSAVGLGYKIIEHSLFDYSESELNPTGIIIIEKITTGIQNKPEVVCPISRKKLYKINNSLLYSKESCLAYPIIKNIPCLLSENSILASHLLTNYQKFKRQHNIDIK